MFRTCETGGFHGGSSEDYCVLESYTVDVYRRLEGTSCGYGSVMFRWNLCAHAVDYTASRYRPAVFFYQLRLTAFPVMQGKLRQI